MYIFAKRALLDHTWVRDLRVTVENGVISALKSEETPGAQDIRVDTLLPSLANLHSHAFQRAMAGMTEFRAAGQESFWTWRALMYNFLDHLAPEHVEAIAALVQMEMLEAGYASVGEFHYVHHAAGGQTYDRLNELSDRIFAAASQTGIGLTHLPVLYTYGGVRQEPLVGGQLRFYNQVDRFHRLLDACETSLGDLPSDAVLGMAPHSLRGTSPEDLARVLAARPKGPVHMHIAEQRQEVADVEVHLGQRPVAWVLDNLGIDARWCLIHATHMTKAETKGLARSGAVAGLCPITEANLGDGIFDGRTYLDSGGVFGLGSDSNVRISLSEEMRMLEYSQRLRDQNRNVLVDGAGSTGQSIYTAAAKGGAQALGRPAGTLALGQLADLVAIDSAAPALCALQEDQLLDGLVFASSDDVVTDTFSAGRHVVQGGRHISRDTILAAYRKTMAQLVSVL